MQRGQEERFAPPERYWLVCSLSLEHVSLVERLTKSETNERTNERKKNQH